LSAKEAADILKSLKTPVILMHARPDGDTAGSCAALIRILRALGIEAQYASADKIPERLAFLLNGEKMAENFEERELVAIDVASPSQLGSLSHLADRVCLTIDHHRVNSPFSDNFTLPDISSAGETLLTVLEELIAMGKCQLDSEIAYPLYAAISSDTGGFVFSSASPKTYRRAALLMETGIDFSEINHKLFFSKSKEQIKAEGFVSSKLSTELGGRIAYATLSKAERDRLGLLGEHFETAIDVVRSVIFAEVAVFVKENDDGSFKASLRSTGVDVASIAKSFGGGGHVRAAGCSVSAKSVEEGAKIIIDAIKKSI
jgi:phosphoesterase RecJ-like protein